MQKPLINSMRLNQHLTLISLALGKESEKIYSYNKSYLIKAYLNRNYLFGEVKDIVQFESYASLSIVAYWYDDSFS